MQRKRFLRLRLWTLEVRINRCELMEVFRRIVTFLIIAPYKYSYLITYLKCLTVTQRWT